MVSVAISEPLNVRVSEILEKKSILGEVTTSGKTEPYSSETASERMSVIAQTKIGHGLIGD
jgi:hypothetical protein